MKICKLSFQRILFRMENRKVGVRGQKNIKAIGWANPENLENLTENPKSEQRTSLISGVPRWIGQNLYLMFKIRSTLKHIHGVSCADHTRIVHQDETLKQNYPLMSILFKPNDLDSSFNCFPLEL